MESTEQPRISRRNLLATGTALGVGAVVGVGVGRSTAESGKAIEVLHGRERVPFYGKHQSGVETTPAAHATFLAIDLNKNTTKPDLRRLMRLLSDSAARLTQGGPALADTEPELAATPSRLTVTFGFGPRFVEIAKAKKPSWLQPLPAFSIDELDEHWNDGDLLIQVSAEDPITVAHTVRVLSKDARTFGAIRWRQDGFRRSPGTEATGTTMRNLFGQVDGTVNPEPGTREFDSVVWSNGGWWADGTGLVIRRIAMHLDSWDPVSRVGREEAIGRRLSDGAPLTGTKEHDEPDLKAKDEHGLSVIAEYAHLRRAQTSDPTQVIFRRPYNYDLAPEGESVTDSGLIFAAYQADVGHQFIPIQQQLSELDMLNEWTTPIGSAVFVIPPGCAEGGFIGDSILS